MVFVWDQWWSVWILSILFILKSYVCLITSVVHLFSFLLCFFPFILFVFVLCSVYPVCPVTLDCAVVCVSSDSIVLWSVCPVCPVTLDCPVFCMSSDSGLSCVLFYLTRSICLLLVFTRSVDYWLLKIKSIRFGLCFSKVDAISFLIKLNHDI